MHAKRIIAGALMIVSSMALVLIMSKYFFFADACDQNVTNTVVSPDGKTKAVNYLIYCGPLDSESDNVSLFAANDDVVSELSKPGNAAVMSPSGIMDMTWKNGELVVYYNPEYGSLSQSHPLVNGVHVRYVASTRKYDEDPKPVRTP